MNTTTATTESDLAKLADQLLDRAYRASATAELGVSNVRHTIPGYGEALVSYDRRTKTYDVGTEAKCFGNGKRGAVRQPLIDLLKK